MTDSVRHDKINWLLILQGWAILCVVTGHAPMPAAGTSEVVPEVVIGLYRFVHSFHMPLFIFISGYLFQMTRIERPLPYPRMIADKLARLGIPLLAFTFAAMVLKTVFAKEVMRPATTSAGSFIDAVLYPGSGPLSEMWFIAAIMWYFALKPVWTIKGWWSAIPVLLFTASFYAPGAPFRDLFSYREAYHYAIFFCLGVLARRYGVFEKPLRFGIPVAVTAISWGVVADTIVPGVTPRSCLSLPLTGIAASSFAAIAFSRTYPRLFGSFRNYSYQIYLMGIFFQTLVKIAYRHRLLPSYMFAYIVCILIGIYAPVAVSRLAERYGNKPLKLCFGLK